MVSSSNWRMRLPGAASSTEHWLACAVKTPDMSAPRPARKLGNFGGQRGSFSAISNSAFARDHSNVFGYSGFETQPQLRLLVLTV